MYQPYVHEENQLLLPSEFFLLWRSSEPGQPLNQARPDGAVGVDAKSFKKSFHGQKAISVRMALGAFSWVLPAFGLGINSGIIVR